MNIRDFQWKTWTPMELNMDGWGSNEKYPHALGEPATSINRMYLKLKSELMPYAYSFAKEAVDGMPIIRAMFLEFPNDYTMGSATKIPIYVWNRLPGGTYLSKIPKQMPKAMISATVSICPKANGSITSPARNMKADALSITSLLLCGNSPVFVKNGAIIPMTNPNNNVSEINKGLRIYEMYPNKHTMTVEYDDDGITEAYKDGKGVTTFIESNVTPKNEVLITVHRTQGNFDGFVKEKATEFRINVTEKPKAISAKAGKSKIKLTEVASLEQFQNGQNVYFYDAAPNLNKFATPGSEFEKVTIVKNPQLLIKLAPMDVTTNQINVTVSGFRYAPADTYRVTSGSLTAPKAEVTAENTEAYTLKPTWTPVANADYYEIELNGILYSTIKDTELLFEGLEAETTYDFKIRAVNKDGQSDWASFTAKTKSNPLEFAIRGIKGEVTAKSQEGFEIDRLFDFAEMGDMWHTKYRANALPFDMIIDLRSVNQLDKFHYLSRKDGGNGTLLKGTVSYSMDKEHWTGSRCI